MVRTRAFCLAALLASFSGCSSNQAGVDDLSAAVNESAPGPVADAQHETDAWTVTNAWSDRDTPDARAKGLAWDANSGLSWTEKYERWLASFEVVPNSEGSGDTIKVTSPYGKAMPIAALECAEVAMLLRALFASYYHLPFYVSAWDVDSKRMVYIGHFGAVDAGGHAMPHYPRFGAQFQDSELSWKMGDPWPTDARLQKRHLDADRDGDKNDWIAPGAGFGAWIDDMTLNKRAAWLIVTLLDAMASLNLADDINMFHIKPEATSPGDVLLERTDKSGIGHTIPVFRVDTVKGHIAPYVATGSMPRVQAEWQDPLVARFYFISDEMGGEGTGNDGTPYAKLGGGIRRWRVAVRQGGHWSNVVPPEFASAFISGTDVKTIAGRPKKFEEVLAYSEPADRKQAALTFIGQARARLRQHPASCAARARREDAFGILYGAVYDLEQKDSIAVDREYRLLEDWVFKPLDYTSAKTCCWNRTTPQMAEIILDMAKQEQEQAKATNVCKVPTVFRATGGGDGYTLWAEHAQQMGRAADWKAWSEDEPCSQRGSTEDPLEDQDTDDFCEVLGPPPPPPTPTPTPQSG